VCQRAGRRPSCSVQIAGMSPTSPRRLSTPYREPGEIPAYSVLSRSGFPQDLMPVHLPPAEHSEHEGPGNYVGTERILLSLICEGDGVAVLVLLKLGAEQNRIRQQVIQLVSGQQCEVLTLHATEQWHGVGTALIEAVEQMAAGHGCARLWLITTNDNADALRFYQRRGFQLAAIHRRAVDDSRSRLKPEIPAAGAYGIPIRDEIELEKRP